MNEYTKPLVDPKDPKHPNQWKKYGFHLIDGGDTFSFVLPRPFKSEDPNAKILELVDVFWELKDIRTLCGTPIDVKKSKLLVYRSKYDVMELETPPVIHNRAYLTGWLEGKYIG